MHFKNWSHETEEICLKIQKIKNEGKTSGMPKAKSHMQCLIWLHLSININSNILLLLFS